jgi:hypothetical protein
VKEEEASGVVCIGYRQGTKYGGAPMIIFEKIHQNPKPEFF